MESASCSIGFSKLNSPAHRCLWSTLQETPRDVSCKTRGQDGFATSFPVGLLHPLQHAGFIPALSEWPTIWDLSHEVSFNTHPDCDPRMHEGQTAEEHGSIPPIGVALSPPTDIPTEEDECEANGQPTYTSEIVSCWHSLKGEVNTLPLSAD
jgi:hypothetical protein